MSVNLSINRVGNQFVDQSRSLHLSRGRGGWEILLRGMEAGDWSSLTEYKSGVEAVKN